MTNVLRWEVDVVREGRWWLITPRTPVGHEWTGNPPVTQARKLCEVPAMAAELLYLSTDQVVVTSDVTIASIRVAGRQTDFWSKGETLARTREQIAYAQESLNIHTKLMVDDLIAGGVVTRDIAAIIGLSAQRVSQIRQSK